MIQYMPPVELSADEQASLVKGVTAKLYHLTKEYGKMPDFRLIAGNRRKTVILDSVSETISDATESDYAGSYDAYVLLDTDANYEFKLMCDDCARLYIDGRLIAECAYDAERPGDAVVSAESALKLAAGYHVLRVEYAEVREGNRLLSLEIGGGNAEFFTAEQN